MPNLFFFTHHFPYKEGAETFIENELPIASEYFDHVYIVPLLFDEKRRAIPSNCSIIEPPFRKKSDIIKKGIKGLSPRIFISLLKELYANKYWKRAPKLKSFIIQSLVFSTLISSEQLLQIKRLIKPNDLLYSYWGIGWSMVIPFDKYLSNKFVSRFHRGDLYLDRDGALLFRKSLLERLDKAVFISREGEEYQHRHFPDISFESEVSYLGTVDHGVSQKSQDNKLRILSCSHLNPVKRVDLIFKALCEFSNPLVEWTHIGGTGQALGELKKLVELTPHNFQVNLLGGMSNTEVLEWYKHNPVDIFINVSSSEGLPVSIMEAISFDLPVLATDVGGTAEIVNDQTGILLSPNPSEKEIVNALKFIQNGKYLPRKFWENNFKAETNFIKFYNSMLQLS